MDPVQSNGQSFNSILERTNHQTTLNHERIDCKLDIANEEHLQILLKFVSPAAMLTEYPSLIEYYHKGIKLRILNYTEVNFFFTLKNNKLYLFADDVKVAGFTEENCHIVVYHVEGSSAICIDNKKDCMNVPRTRMIISSKGEHCTQSDFSEKEFENLTAVFAMQPSSGDNFLRTDPTMIDLLNNMDSHAICISNTLGVYYSRANLSLNNESEHKIYRLTVLNYTDQKITFDIRRCLRVNGKMIEKEPYTPEHCQIAAYYLKEFHKKYIHLLIKDEGLPQLQKVTLYESWKQKRTIKDTSENISSKKTARTTQPAIKLQQFLNTKANTSPELSKVLKNNPHFAQLMQETSPYAIEISHPSIVECLGTNRSMRILNLTYHSLSLNENNELHLNGMPITLKHLKLGRSNYNQHIIAYKVPKNPDIICLEIKNDDDHLPQQRHFILKQTDSYEIFSALSFRDESLDHRLFAIRPQQCIKKAIKIMKDIQKCSVPSYVTQGKTGYLTIYPSRTDSNIKSNKHYFSFVNYTSKRITTDILNRFWIDNRPGNLHTPLYKASMIVAFHPENNPEIIQLETSQDQIILEKRWSYLNDYCYDLFYRRLFKTIHFERVYNNLWKRQYDKNSVFSTLPQELIHKIAIKYFECLKQLLKWKRS